MPYLPCHYLYISFIYCTCLVPTISVLNLVIFPWYSNLLLRRRRWIGILWWGVLGYVLPRLLFLWCYGVFRCSVLLRVILVFKDTIYVIIILYIRDIWLSVSTFGRMCGTIDPGSCIRWVLGFGVKTGYDTSIRPESRIRPKSSIRPEPHLLTGVGHTTGVTCSNWSRAYDRCHTFSQESGKDWSCAFWSESGIRLESHLPIGIGHTTVVAHMTGATSFVWSWAYDQSFIFWPGSDVRPESHKWLESCLPTGVRHTSGMEAFIRSRAYDRSHTYDQSHISSNKN
jgi:hypothetical protein